MIKIETFPACEQTLHFRDVERSHARETRERRREKGGGILLRLGLAYHFEIESLLAGYKIS